jgi:hypothetical protein
MALQAEPINCMLKPPASQRLKLKYDDLLSRFAFNLNLRPCSLDVLQWLRERRCPWNATTCEWAAAKGHLVMLQWLREHHCPWGEGNVCLRAAMGGHLELLKWAWAKGCPW